MKSLRTLSPAGFLVPALLGACFSTGTASGQDSKGRSSSWDNLKIGFHPLELVGLGPGINVYPTMQAKDAWGSLEVTDGAILAADFSGITVAAPARTAGTQLQGPGWTLQLAAGWQVVPAAKPGSYVLRRQ